MDNQNTAASSPLQQGGKKKILIIVGIVVVLLTIAATFFLVSQQQNISQQAREDTSPFCGTQIKTCINIYTGGVRYSPNITCVNGEREMSWGSGNTGTQINSCYSLYTGVVRSTQPGRSISCASSERPLTWFQGDLNSTTLSGCVNRYTSRLRIPNRSGTCSSGEFEIRWATNTSDQCVEPSQTPTNIPTPTTTRPTPTFTPIPTAPTPRSTNTPTPANVCNQQCFSDADCAGGGTACGTCRAVNGSFEKICTTPIGGQPTPTFTPTPTTGSRVTPTPTLFPPTLTPTPTPQGTPTPTPTTIPSVTPEPDESVLTLTLQMPGIGQEAGDNTNPLRNPREADLTIFNTNNEQVFDGGVTVQYTAGNYKGSVSLALQEGTYYARVRLDNTLNTTINGVFELTHNQTTNTPATELIPGDLDQNNTLDIRDYNIFLACFGSKQCSQKTLADFNDNGEVDPIDYNILLRSFAIRPGA